MNMMKMMRMMKTKTMLKMLKSHYIKKLYKYMNMLITSNNEENNDKWDQRKLMTRLRTMTMNTMMKLSNNVKMQQMNMTQHMKMMTIMNIMAMTTLWKWCSDEKYEDEEYEEFVKCWTSWTRTWWKM